MFRKLAFVIIGIGGYLLALLPACGAGQAQDTSHLQPPFTPRNPRYQVRPGDVLELSFLPTVEFNQTVSVQPDGYITLREIGDVYVEGSTIPEVTAAVTSRYLRILHEPAITVLLKEFDKPHFVVGGQVEHPGKFDLRADTTVAEAVAMAGGLNEKAKHSQVLLFRRVSEDWVEAKQIDLKAILKGRIKEDIHLRPGDMVYVPQNRISKIKPYLPTSALTAYGPMPF